MKIQWPEGFFEGKTVIRCSSLAQEVANAAGDRDWDEQLLKTAYRRHGTETAIRYIEPNVCGYCKASSYAQKGYTVIDLSVCLNDNTINTNDFLTMI